jgi:hypothetical protein
VSNTRTVSAVGSIAKCWKVFDFSAADITRCITGVWDLVVGFERLARVQQARNERGDEKGARLLWVLNRSRARRKKRKCARRRKGLFRSVLSMSLRLLLHLARSRQFFRSWSDIPLRSCFSGCFGGLIIDDLVRAAEPRGGPGQIGN